MARHSRTLLSTFQISTHYTFQCTILLLRTYRLAPNLLFLRMKPKKFRLFLHPREKVGSTRQQCRRVKRQFFSVAPGLVFSDQIVENLFHEHEFNVQKKYLII